MKHEDGGDRPLCVLVVDDSRTTRRAIGLMLSDMCEVVEATDGEEGLDVLKTRHVDLVLTDMHMPNLDGLGLVRAARALPGHASTPILVLTTEGHDDIKEDLRFAGASGVIEKPVERETLRRTMKWHLT